MIYDVRLADGSDMQIEADATSVDGDWVHFWKRGDEESWVEVATAKALVVAPRQETTGADGK